MITSLSRHRRKNGLMALRLAASGEARQSLSLFHFHLTPTDHKLTQRFHIPHNVVATLNQQLHHHCINGDATIGRLLRHIPVPTAAHTNSRRNQEAIRLISFYNFLVLPSSPAYRFC